MKIKLTAFFSPLLLFIFCSTAAAQNTDSQKYVFVPPAQEQFTDIDALASPWRVGRCPDIFYKPTKNCHEVDGAEYVRTT